MRTIEPPRYAQFAVSYRVAGREELEMPAPLIGFPDCQAIDARIVCNRGASTAEVAFLLDLVKEWEGRLLHSTIKRVEFLNHKGDSSRLGLRGALLYDGSEVPFAHIVNAIMGYTGHGSELSKKLLTQVLHMSTSQAEAIESAAKRFVDAAKPHVVVVEMNPTTYMWEWKIFPG